MSNIHKNFNSRTRVGATIRGEDVPVMLEVSIHAPVWVRLRQTSGPHPRHGFQFTHPCGCDTLTWSLYENGAGFNSRTRVGATSDSYSYRIFINVSIHAPVWVRRYGS